MTQPINYYENHKTQSLRHKPSPAPPWMAEHKAQIDVYVQAKLNGVKLPEALSKQIHEEH